MAHAVRDEGNTYNIPMPGSMLYVEYTRINVKYLVSFFEWKNSALYLAMCPCFRVSKKSFMGSETAHIHLLLSQAMCMKNVGNITCLTNFARKKVRCNILRNILEGQHHQLLRLPRMNREGFLLRSARFRGPWKDHRLLC